MSKTTMVAVSLWLMATSVMGEGYVTFNGTVCTKAIDGKVAVGDLLTRDKMVNNGVTVSAAGAAKNSLIDGANWSDGAAVSAENDYLISGPNGRVATLSGEVGFGGKSLTLGEVGGNKGFLVPVGSTSFTIGGEGLIINNGGFVWNSSYQKPTLFNGKLKVNTTRSSPAVFWDHWSGAQHHTFNFTTLVGESTAGINFTGQSHASDEVYKNRLSFSGDWSAYYGLVKIATYYNKVDFSNVNCPGDLDYSSGTVTSLSGGGDDFTGSIKFGSIKLKSDTSIQLGVNSKTNATLTSDRLDVVGEGKLPLSLVMGGLPVSSYPCDLSTPARQLVFVDLPETSASVYDLFSVSVLAPANLSNEEKKYLIYRTLAASSLKERVGDGRRKLVCDIPKYTYTTKRGKNQVESLLDHPEYWQGVEEDGFCSDTAYFVFDDPDSIDGTVTLTQNKEIVFAGGPLCLMDGYVITGGRMTFNDLRVAAEVTLQFGGNGSLHEFNGNMTILDRNKNGAAGSVHFWSKANNEMVVNSKLHGNGTIMIDSANWSPEEMQTNRTVSLKGDNSGFNGKITVRNYADGFRSTLKINSGKALGGELNVFAEDAIWLRERSVLEVVDNAKISEVTRGVFADDTSTIKVTAAGNVFEIGSVLTLSGCVTKVGPGALALTQVAAKGDAKPVLKVDEGSLVAAGKDAIKGVKLQFAEAAALEFNIDGDAALLASGLDVSDCEIEHADGKLAVFCKTAGEMQSAEKKTIALFSGSAAAVANLSGRIDVKLVDSQNRTRRANLELADSPVEGGKILMASFEKRGMIIHFR